MTERAELLLTGLPSRRATLRAGGGLLATLGALALPGSGRALGTPSAVVPGSGLLLVQSFGKGSLFPTQGDVGVLPYTLILWDAADRGLFFTDVDSRVAGFAPTNALLIAIEAGERPQAAVVVPAAADNSRPQQVWALRLAYGGLGSDPGAVTYQGEEIDEAEATAWLGVTPAALPDGPQELVGGYLLIAGLPGLDLPEDESVQIALS